MHNDKLQNWRGEHTGSNYVANHILYIVVLGVQLAQTQTYCCTVITRNAVRKHASRLSPKIPYILESNPHPFHSSREANKSDAD